MPVKKMRRAVSTSMSWTISAIRRRLGREQLDEKLMSELAAKVYPRAKLEFEDLLRQIESGEPIAI